MRSDILDVMENCEKRQIGNVVFISDLPPKWFKAKSVHDKESEDTVLIGIQDTGDLQVVMPDRVTETFSTWEQAAAKLQSVFEILDRHRNARKHQFQSFIDLPETSSRPPEIRTHLENPNSAYSQKHGGGSEDRKGSHERKGTAS